MKRICLGFMLAMGLYGCDKPSTSGGATAGDSANVSVAAHDSSADHAKHKEAKPSTDESISSTASLGGLEGMTLETSMEMDDFRGRLEHDWGDVHNILRASGSTFEHEGKDYLVAKGEIKQGGFPWAAIMVVDLKQDAVFAAQFDGENKRIDQFEEEKEGLSQPTPLTTWTKKYN